MWQFHPIIGLIFVYLSLNVGQLSTAAFCRVVVVIANGSSDLLHNSIVVVNTIFPCTITHTAVQHKVVRTRSNRKQTQKKLKSGLVTSYCYANHLHFLQTDKHGMPIMVALGNRTDHYIFVLWFLSSFFLFSLPNLSGRRLDVYQTSTYGVALVRIQNAGLKPAARGSLKYTMQKSRQQSPSGHHRTTLSGYIFATKARIDNVKKC